jgi:hypothetical protein
MVLTYVVSKDSSAADFRSLTPASAWSRAWGGECDRSPTNRTGTA